MTGMSCFPKRRASKSINCLVFNVLLLLSTPFPKIIARKRKITNCVDYAMTKADLT